MKRFITAFLLMTMSNMMLGSFTAQAQTPAAGAAIRVTHTKLSDGDSERRTGQVTYRIDWVLTGAPPTGLTRFTRYEACFHSFNGNKVCTTTNGNARTATVSIPLFSGAVAHGNPFASVTGFGPCERIITWKPSGESSEGQCPISGLRFTTAPRLVTTNSNSANGQISSANGQISVPGLGVKVDWQVNAPVNNTIFLKGFTVSAMVQLPTLERPSIELPGQQPRLELPLERLQSATGQAGATERTKTLSFGSQLRLGGSGSLEQARVALIAEWRIEGRSN